MSEKKDEPVVELEREAGKIHFGQNEYNSNWAGSRSSRNIAIVKTLAFPAALMAMIFIYFSKGKSVDGQGAEIQSPNISNELPLINTRVLGERDRINNISAPSIKASALGLIKIFNLRGQSQIPVGAEAKAVLVSGATNGIVKAKLLSPIVVDGEVVVQENAIVFGRGKSGDERLYVEFSKAIFGTGEAFPIRAQAFDYSDKILGLKGSFIGTKTTKMAKAMGFGFLGGMADGLQQNTSGSIFMSGQRPSVRDGALAGTSKAMLDQSQAYMEEMKNTPNIIEVKQGSEFFLIFDEPQKKDN